MLDNINTSSNPLYTSTVTGPQQTQSEQGVLPTNRKALQKDEMSTADQTVSNAYTPPASNPQLDPAKSSQPDRPKNGDTPPDEGQINEAYKNLLNQNISKYASSHNLSAEDVQSLLTASLNPDNATIPANIKEMLTEITNQTTSAIIAKFKLSETWKPTAPTLDKSTLVDNAASYLNDIDKILEKYSDKIPNGPNRIILANYLKAIGKAIRELQDQIAAMEIQAGENRKDLTASQKEMMDLKLELHMKALAEQAAEMARIAAEQAKADKKGGLIGKIMKVVTPIVIALSVVATIASLGTAGPAAIALSVALLTLTIVEQAKPELSLSQKVFGAIGKGVYELAKACGASEKEAKMAELVTNCVVTVALIASGKFGGNLSLGIMTATQVFTNSNIVHDACIANGMSEQQAALIAGIVNACVMLVGMLAAGAAGPSKGQVAENIARTTNRINRATAAVERLTAIRGPLTAAERVRFGARMASLIVQRAASRAALTLMRGESSTRLLFGVAGLGRSTAGGMQVANAFVEQTIGNLRADLERMKGQAEAGDVTLQTIIDSLKAALKKLLELMESLMSWSVETNKMNAKVVENNKVDFALQG